MGMTATVFFMKDDSAGLSNQTQLLFSAGNRILKDFDGYIFRFRRAEAC